MSKWGWRAYAIAGVIAVQVAVPLVALFDDPPTRFGFQMYSAVGGTDVSVRDDSGHKLPFDPATVLAGQLRPEVDWTRRLPERVCAAVPQAHTVTVRRPHQERTVTCN